LHINGRITALTASLVLAGSLGTAAGAAQAAALKDASGIGLAVGSGKAHGYVLKDNDLAAKANKSSLWDKTPSGYVFHSCDYTVPNGSNVNSVTGVITLPNGKTENAKKCDYPRITDDQTAPPTGGPSSQQQATPNSLPAVTPANALAESAKTGKPPAASASGWFQWFGNNNSGNRPFTYWYSKIATPAAPSVTSSGLSNFTWGGLGSHDNTTLLQPIVGWGPISVGKPLNTQDAGSGNHLWMAPYYFWSGNAVATTAFTINYQDPIEVDVEATSCNSVGGSCTYRLDSTDDTTGQTLGMTVNTGATFTTVYGGVYEKWNINGCDETFGNGHIAFRQQVIDSFVSSSNMYAPTNPEYGWFTVDQECGMLIENYLSGTGGDIIWTP